MQRQLSLCAVAVLGLMPALLVAEARAQPSGPPNPSPAAALYDEAVAAMDKKDYTSACPKLEEVVRIEPRGIGAKFTLAECYEESGRLASAWTAYAVAESAAAQENQIPRQKKAQQRGAALKPKLAQLTIAVPEAVRGLPGLAIRRDGAVLESGQWGVPLPVDKGNHVIVATATGKRPWEKTVEVTADGVSVATSVEGLVDAEPTPVAPAKLGPAPLPGKKEPALPPVNVNPVPDTGISSQRVVGLLVGGLGLVGLGVGTAFGLIAIDKQTESNDGHCEDGNQCDQTGVDLRDEGLTAGTVSTVMFVVGSVALAGGVTLFATAPSASEGAGTKVSVGPGGVLLSGTW